MSLNIDSYNEKLKELIENGDVEINEDENNIDIDISFMDEDDFEESFSLEDNVFEDTIENSSFINFESFEQHNFVLLRQDKYLKTIFAPLKEFFLDEYEELHINEANKMFVTLKNGKKINIPSKDLGFLTKEYLELCQYVLANCNKKHWDKNDNKRNSIRVMLPWELYRWFGDIGTSIDTGLVIRIRLNKYNSNISFEDFGLNNDEIELIKKAIKDKASMFISGNTGTGKTTFSNTCIKEMPLDDSIRLIGDIYDYDLRNHYHTTRKSYDEQANQEEEGALIRSIQTSTADRVMFAELIPNNAIALLRISGLSSGVMCTMHANSTENLESMFITYADNRMSEKEIKNSLDRVDFIFITDKDETTNVRYIKEVKINNPDYLRKAINQNLFSGKLKYNPNTLKQSKIIKEKPQQRKNTSSKEISLEAIENAIQEYINEDVSIDFLSNKHSISVHILRKEIAERNLAKEQGRRKNTVYEEIVEEVYQEYKANDFKEFPKLFKKYQETYPNIKENTLYQKVMKYNKTMSN